MIATSLRTGFRAAFTSPRLIVTVWLWNALMAFAAGAGVWRWLGSALNYAPESDKALERFHLGLLLELIQYDRFSPMTMLNGVVLGMLVAGALSNPVLSGGILEVLVSRDDRPILHRFFRGAGHFYGRFLRLMLISAAAGLVLVIGASALTAPITRAIGETSRERSWLLASFLRLLFLGALVAYVMAVLDAARATVVTASVEMRGMLRAWLSAAGLVLRRAGSFAGVYLALGAVWLLVAVAGLIVVGAVPATNWGGILLLFVVQQGFMIARATLRIARAGASVQLATAAGHGAAATSRAEPVPASA